MRSSNLLASVAVALVLAAPSLVAAQPKEAAKKPVAAKDSAGGKIYADLLAKGEKAFVARDVPSAIATFQEAIKRDPEKMLGYYRLGEALLASGKPEEAEAAWKSGLAKKNDADLSAKLLFQIADLRERQAKWSEVKEAWSAYTAHLTANPKVVGYAKTAVERQKQADRRIQDEKDYGAVKARGIAREAEKVKEAEENAKADKLNR
jgi:tetratricopeptide (TPR) repeat protein